MEARVAYMENRMRVIADKITVPSDFITQVGEEVLEVAKRDMPKWCRVGKTIISGSFGKKTAISLSVDVDVVLMVPDLDLDDDRAVYKARQNLADVLVKGLKIPAHDVRVPRVGKAVQLEYKGIDFDIVLSSLLSDLQQVKLALPMVESDGNNNELLAEVSANFLRDQSSDVHVLCKLAKLWQKLIYYDGYVAARSVMFETIAVYAGIKYEKEHNGKISLVECFEEFLMKVANIDKIRIEFEGYLERRYNVELPRACPAEDGIYLPENPWKNVLKDVPQEFIGMAKATAEKAVKLMAAYISGRTSAQDILNNIFDHRKICTINKKMPTDFLVGTSSLNVNAFRRLGIQINRPGPAVNIPFIKYLGAALMVSLVIADNVQEEQSVADNNGSTIPVVTGGAMKGAQDFIENKIDTTVHNQPPQKWFPSTQTFPSKQVVLTIPIGQTNKVVKVGFEMAR